MKILIALIISLLVVSCKEKVTPPVSPINQDEVFTMSHISNYDSISKLVKTKGDLNAYDELFYFLMDSNKEDRTDTLMYYSKIMSEKFNSERAYLDYFKALCEKYNINVDLSNYSSVDISSIDMSAKKKAENWLKKMLEKKIITQEQYDSVKR
jgi:hypothetical protein